MTDPTPEQQLAELRRRMGSLAEPGPTGDQIADWNTADRAMAERIHTARPGLPLHHVYAVLQTLRSATWLEETAAEQSARTTPDNSVTSGDAPDNPRQSAYDAVYAYLRSTNRMPGDLAYRNAMIWRAVHAALDAVGVPELGNFATPVRDLAVELLAAGRAYSNRTDRDLASEESRAKSEAILGASWRFAEAAGLPKDWDLQQIRDAAAEMAATQATDIQETP